MAKCLGHALDGARQVFDVAETQCLAGSFPIQSRSKEQIDASETLVLARFAFVDHKAGCKMCMSDRALRYPTKVSLH
jgi:hypothetical protein